MKLNESLPHNKKMQDFLAKNGIKAAVKYIDSGSMKRTWRLYNKNQNWTPDLQQKLTKLGFKGFDGKPLNQFSGNGGKFSVFVIPPEDLKKTMMGENKVSNVYTEKVLNIATKLSPKTWFWDDKQGFWEIGNGYINPFGATGDEEIIYYGRNFSEEKKIPFKLSDNAQRDAKLLINKVKKIVTIIGENKMSKKKKQNVNEGMIMVSSLLPVGKIDGLVPRRKDNFKFKGLPGQFNEHGEKVLDEQGNPIDEALVSFDHKEVLKRSSSLFPLLGDFKDNSGVRNRVVADIVKVLEKYSSLKSRK